MLDKSVRTHALCLAKPICNSVCSGDSCCFAIRVGVWFFRGGNVAIVRPIQEYTARQIWIGKAFDFPFDWMRRRLIDPFSVKLDVMQSRIGAWYDSRECDRLWIMTTNFLFSSFLLSSYTHVWVPVIMLIHYAAVCVQSTQWKTCAPNAQYCHTVVHLRIDFFCRRERKFDGWKIHGKRWTRSDTRGIFSKHVQLCIFPFVACVRHRQWVSHNRCCSLRDLRLLFWPWEIKWTFNHKSKCTNSNGREEGGFQRAHLTNDGRYWIHLYDIHCSAYNRAPI